MIRRLGALAASGLLLGACATTQSPASALRGWVHQSNFAAGVATLRHDAAHAASALRDASAGPNDLHTVCGVMSVDASSANASLPTPDEQATALLGRAYGLVGAAASRCYDAGDSAARRARALATLQSGLGVLAEATARVTAAS